MTLKLPSKLPAFLSGSSEGTEKIKTVFVTKPMLPPAVNEPVYVVLSPAFYWFREEVLPARNAAQAKKLAPSFFDTVIPEGSYEYFAIAKGEAFWLFAYDPAAIAEYLDDIGLKPARIKAVYFAQTECSDTDVALRIDDDTSLISVDGVMSVVSSRYAPAETTVEEQCEKTPRSRHKVPVSLYRSTFLDERKVFRLTAVAVAFLAVYLGNFLLLRYQYRQQLVREATLKAHYRLPETSFQLKSLMRSLEGRQARQLRFRKRFKQLTKLPLQRGEAVKSLRIDMKKADLVIALLQPKRAEVLKDALQKQGRITAAKVKDKTFYVSVAYE